MGWYALKKNILSQNINKRLKNPYKDNIYRFDFKMILKSKFNYVF